jgi:putative protein-disulfide isomerase
MELIYVADPMCSWCYGFAPELSKVKAHFGDSLKMNPLMGGLRAFGKEEIQGMESFLKGHWDAVKERTGQPFQYDILKDATFIYDTEPSCRAVVTMRHFDPEKAFGFFKEVQSLFYYENKDVRKGKTYYKAAEQFGVKPSDFQAAFDSDEIKQATLLDFQTSRDLGVNSFPTTVFKYKEKLYLVAKGYSEASQVIQILEEIIKIED